MIRIACYALFGLVGLLLQTSIFPRFLPFQFKPDLILILVVYLGISQKYGTAECSLSVLVCYMMCLQGVLLACTVWFCCL